MNLTIGLVYDLRKEYLAEGYSEEEVAEFDSESTINALDDAIKSLGHRTDRVGHVRALCKRLAAGDRWDLVFNIAEGLKGRSREAQAPAILEAHGIPYTFSDPLVSAVTLDKAVTKRLLQAALLPTAPFCVVESLPDINNISLHYPLFAKPVAEGTGKGVGRDSRVDSPEALRRLCRRLLERYGQPVLVEEFLPGREFTVGILGAGTEARVLGTMEIAILNNDPNAIYSLHTKELCESLVRYSPAAHDELRSRVEDLALKSYKVLQCRDAARVDIRLDRNGDPNFMELNPLPGLHPTHSDLPMIATQEGMSYKELIGAILNGAMKRSYGKP